MRADVSALTGYLSYVALLTQSGTDAPVATVLANDLGGEVVWTRNGMGDYRGTLAGAFPVQQYFSPCPAVTGWDSSTNSGGGGNGYYVARLTDNMVIVATISGNDDELVNGTIEIRVYPA